MKKWVVFSCTHGLFRNKRLWNNFCYFIKDYQPDGLVNVGDFIDAYSTSRHNYASLSKLKGITLGEEYTDGIEMLENLQWALPDYARRVLIFGNHEDNVIRWFDTDDNSKLGDAMALPRQGLQLDSFGYEVVGDYADGWKQEVFEIIPDRLIAMHGTFCGIHAAKKHLDEFDGYSVLMGHTHRMQSYLTGKRGAWNIGGLFDKQNPGFHYVGISTRNKWCNGFATVEVANDESFYVNTIRAENGCFVANGKFYDAEY